MTDRRQPSTPPDLPGYTYSRLLGLGGFADVFLYRQELPARDVAVKVLLAPTLDDQAKERFVTEANLMAQLSHHPAIVTVHHAAFAADSRPYLVMEYCSRPGLAERYRTERMTIAECLRIGVRLASAVASTHEAGILHRDIKPANVLTTDFGWPALTDFGIAAATGRSNAAIGMSIPWAPPELLSPEPAGDERSDVYSLAATVYSMLAGRTPFEVPGTPNTAGELVGRIERMALPRIGRPDVTDDLQNVLARAMARRLDDRNFSAIGFARALQKIEESLGLPVTVLDLVETAPTGPRTETLDDATRVRAIVDPARGGTPLESEDTRDHAIAHPGEVRVILAHGPGGAASPESIDDPADDSPPRRGLTVAFAGAALLGVIGGAVLLGQTLAPDPAPIDSGYAAVPASVAAAVPAVVDLTGSRTNDDEVTFTWSNPSPQDGDQYLWWVESVGADDAQRALVDATTVVVKVAPSDEHVCIGVLIRRTDGRLSSQPTVGCTP